ncbi:hypothetical protein GCM10022226_58170 [Sphaerisporangium flaviroseum]|uniref:Uncharacterized protein n=1 Tax=Sphaerisporangium flaviroseum TaxID=509199 RepID=A0ABP7IXR2_9ACTN
MHDIAESSARSINFLADTWGSGADAELCRDAFDHLRAKAYLLSQEGEDISRTLRHVADDIERIKSNFDDTVKPSIIEWANDLNSADGSGPHTRARDYLRHINETFHYHFDSFMSISEELSHVSIASLVPKK